MDNKANLEKMKVLIVGLKGLNKIKKAVSKKLDYFGYQEYLEKECELNLRIILDKNFNGIELNDNEKELIEKYMTFSTMPRCKSCDFEPDWVTYQMISKYGSGKFSEEECKIFKEIHSKMRKEQYEKNQKVNDDELTTIRKSK